MLVQGVSGFAIEARGWRVKDQKIVLDRKFSRAGLTLEKMLAAIDEGVAHRGPYELEEGQPAQWAKICTPDLLACLVRVRVLTDPELAINHVCTRCGERLELKIDLNDIAYIPMSSVALESLRSPDKPIKLFIDPARMRVPLYDLKTCEVKLPEDIQRAQLLELSLRMLYGADQRTIAKLQREDPEGVIELETSLRITEVKEPGGKVIKGFEGVREWYSGQSWGIQHAIEDFIDKLEGGPDTDVDIDCSSCRTAQKFRIPFGPDFFGMRSI